MADLPVQPPLPHSQTETDQDKAVLGRLKFLVLNLEMFVCCQRQEYAKLINCHIFRSEERKKKNIKFITRYMSLERERDPQMSDLRVQWYGQVVEFRTRVWFQFFQVFRFQVEIDNEIEKENGNGVEIPVRLVNTGDGLNE